MNRFEAMRLLMDLVTDEFVVCNLGHPAQELFAIRDRPRNFYMLGSMGLASSIGLGLALAAPRAKIVVIEGDGALLMNLGSLATIAANRPPNYVLVAIDNGAYGSTGFQSTFTAGAVDLAAVARACGIERASTARTETETRAELQQALAEGRGPACVVIRADPGMPAIPQTIPCTADEIQHRFMRELAGGGSC